MEVIILTSIVVTLFAVFVITTYRELSNITNKEYVSSKQTGGRASLVNFMGRLFDEESNKKLSVKQKDIIYKAVHRTIADMESEGIYFPENAKEQLEKQREEQYCGYSGLRSVKSYEN
jgi:hypothetical protein